LEQLLILSFPRLAAAVRQAVGGGQDPDGEDAARGQQEHADPPGGPDPPDTEACHRPVVLTERDSP